MSDRRFYDDGQEILGSDVPLPDGSRFNGVFYPFMVDCPNCEGTGQVSPSYSGCPDCYSDGKKRHSALDWMYYCAHSASLWNGDEECIKPEGIDHSKCRPIAVGLKPALPPTQVRGGLGSKGSDA